MGRYQQSYCPGCGALAFKCQCGTSQTQDQLPPAARQRSFMRGMPPPPQQGQQMQQTAYQDGAIDQIMNMPQVQQRVTQVINEALSNYQNQLQAQAPPAPSGVDPALIDHLVQGLRIDEIPGEAPKSNTGGRLNSYKKGREEVFEFFRRTLHNILRGGQLGEQNVGRESQAPAGGEPAAPVGAPGGYQGT